MVVSDCSIHGLVCGIGVCGVGICGVVVLGLSKLCLVGAVGVLEIMD